MRRASFLGDKLGFAALKAKLTKLKTISLFTGAGGLDLGLEAAGFHPSVCVEFDTDSQKTLSLNRPNWPLLVPGDIHRHRTEDVLKRANFKPKETALLAAGPPCQPFSKAALWVNGRAPGMTDDRTQTLRAYLDVTDAALPDVLLLENVRGIARNGAEGGLDFLQRGIAAINKRHGTKYRISLGILDAANYGVPQHRQRIYLIAHRDGKLFEFPSLTHARESATAERLQPLVNTWEAIGDLDCPTWDEQLNPTGKWAGLLPSIPEGHNHLWHTDRGGGMPFFGWRTRYWSFLLKLAKIRPSWTLPATHGPATGPFHWKSRLLSTKELARLQTFPDSFRFLGAPASQKKQIGNATPPLMGEILGVGIRRQFYSQYFDGEFEYSINRFAQAPIPEFATCAPKKYWYLAGHYADHPGVGLGPRAQLRN